MGPQATVRADTKRMIDRDKLTNWYNFQAPLYHFWRDTYDGQLVRRVASLIGDLPPKAVLDAGCGTGLFTIGLARICKRHLFRGVDRSEGMIRVGDKQARKLGISNVSFRIGDVEALTFADAEFDAIVAGGLFCNLNDSSRALAEFSRVLKGGGQVIIVEFDRTAMTAATQVFFKTMITGYKIVSSCFRRFRFADAWDITASTVTEEKFKQALTAAGYAIQSFERLENHWILQCRLLRNKNPRDGE